MRQVKCDACGNVREGDSLSGPIGWFRILRRETSYQSSPVDKALDLCSKKCVRSWLNNSV